MKRLKLRDLIDVMARETPLCIRHGMGPVAVRYDTAEELVEDYLFYGDLMKRPIKEVWFSKNIYNCIVIDLY